MIVYTIGHSTRELNEFIDTLQVYRINQLVDVRSIPKSRHTPQFNADNLCKQLPNLGISYLHLASLGGLRRANKDSLNKAWRNASFRGYADHMQTSEFSKGMEELTKLADRSTVAIMCAEALPWRCHRSMIGDALIVRDYEVIDIMDSKKFNPEKLTEFAVVVGQKITYPSV